MKKNYGFIIIIVVLAMIGGVFYYADYKSKADKTLINEAMEKEAEPYETKLNELRMELNDLQNSVSNGDGSTRYLTYGYYVTSDDDIDNTDGVIVLDMDASEELKVKAKESGREIAYIYSDDAEYPGDADVVVIRESSLDEDISDDISTVSYHIDQLPSEVLDNEKVNIPYIYCKNDEYDIRDRLNSFSRTLFVIYNVGVTNNRLIMDSYTTFELSTISFIREYTIETDSDANDIKETEIAKLKEEISETETKLYAIYQKYNNE